MAITQNLYTGNGSTTNYSFTFPYLEETDVKVSLDGVDTTAYTFANATTIQFNTAPANGVNIRIYRLTDDSELSAEFYSGSAIRAQDLNDNFTQNLYVTQETKRDVADAVAGQIPDGAIGTSKLADGAVTDAKVTSIGSAKSTFTQSGTGAVQRTVESKLQDVVSVKDFGAVGDGVTDDTAAIQAAMSYGIANGKTVVFDFNATIRIPNDAPTLQDAIDHATVSGPYELDLMIQSGHQPNSGVDVSNGDYGFFKISSVDAVVALGASFPATAIIRGTYARMPRLNCLIDANGKGLDGYYANIGSIGWVSIGCGIDNAQQHGCHARTGSIIACGGALFRNASQSSPAYSGILSWGSIIYAYQADVSNSNYYGAQAAAGGILHFRSGIADGCARHNIRGTQAGIVHARYASAQNGGVSGVRAFDKSIVHADSVDVTGSDTGIWAQYGSEILAKDAIANNTTASTIYCDTGSKVVASSLAATTTSSATVVRSENGSEVQLDGATISCPNARALNATNSSRIVMLGGSLSGGDGTRLLGVMDSSKISLKDTNTTCTGAEPYMATVEGGSELSIFDGTHTFPNDSINLTQGSILRLHGSGITALSVPGVNNDAVYGRGIMWGAS